MVLIPSLASWVLEDVVLCAVFMELLALRARLPPGEAPGKAMPLADPLIFMVKVEVGDSSYSIVSAILMSSTI